jgi:hypothetical protein
MGRGLISSPQKEILQRIFNHFFNGYAKSKIKQKHYFVNKVALIHGLVLEELRHPHPGDDIAAMKDLIDQVISGIII